MNKHYYFDKIVFFMKNTMEQILSSERKKFRIYKNIWKQKKQFYQSNNAYALQQQQPLSSDSSSSDDNSDAEDAISFSNGNKKNHCEQRRSMDSKMHAPTSEADDECGNAKIDGKLSSITSMHKSGKS